MLNILINTREKKRSLSLKEKALFLSLLTLVFVALLIPVMQASKNRQLGVDLRVLSGNDNFWTRSAKLSSPSSLRRRSRSDFREGL